MRMPCPTRFASAPTSHLYVFIDESGDFNFSPKGSPFYLFTGLWTYDPTCIASDLISYRYGLLHSGVDVEQFHACKDNPTVRGGVFARLATHGCMKAATIVVRKDRLNPSLYQPWDFYPQFLEYLLKFILKGEYRNKYQQVLLFTDRPPTKKIGQAMRNAIRTNTARYMLRGSQIRMYQHAAMSHSALQAADYCCWAVQRSWIKNDNTGKNSVAHFYDQPELDVFRNGKMTYY